MTHRAILTHGRNDDAILDLQLGLGQRDGIEQFWTWCPLGQHLIGQYARWGVLLATRVIVDVEQVQGSVDGVAGSRRLLTLGERGDLPSKARGVVHVAAHGDDENGSTLGWRAKRFNWTLF